MIEGKSMALSKVESLIRTSKFEILKQFLNNNNDLIKPVTSPFLCFNSSSSITIASSHASSYPTSRFLHDSRDLYNTSFLIRSA